MYLVNWIGILIVSILIANSVPQDYTVLIGNISLILIFQAFLSYIFLSEKEKDDEQ